MRTILAVATLTLTAGAAQAVPIRYDFTIDGSTIQGTDVPSGPHDGGGFVIFDTDLASLADGSGHVGDGHTPLPTLDLGFDWLGQHYDASNSTLGAATFVNGLPTAWQIDSLANSQFCQPSNPPWDRFGCVQFGTYDFTLSALAGGTGNTTMSWVGSTPNSTPYAFAQVTWQESPIVVGVPEPGTLGLMALCLAGLGLARGRRSV